MGTEEKGEERINLGNTQVNFYVCKLHFLVGSLMLLNNPRT